jgi:hypothetical protein
MANDKNPFGNGAGGDGPMKDGGNDFTKNPAPQGPPAGAGNDFTKNPSGFNGGSASPSPCGPDKASIPSGGRDVFPTPGGMGQKPSPHFKLKG